MIYIENKRRKLERIEAEYPNAIILDVTSKAEYAKKLSPFYPHCNIPIPYTDGITATCVEAVWQGLKVFQNEGVDTHVFNNDTMKNLKRTVRRLGLPKGHLRGVYGTELLGYFEARMQIYLPTYKWMLDNVTEVHNIITRIKNKSKEQDIVLLDYNTNIDFRDISSPMSHAGLIKLYIEDTYPQVGTEYTPLSKSEMNEKKELKKTTRRKSKSKNTDTKCINNNQPSLFDV
ncbi:MAG: hypothetical protein SNH18_10185 [Rikenellaceae bacterium]